MAREQGDWGAARHIRAYCEDPPWGDLREARCLEPGGSSGDRPAARLDHALIPRGAGRDLAPTDFGLLAGVRRAALAATRRARPPAAPRGAGPCPCRPRI